MFDTSKEKAYFKRKSTIKEKKERLLSSLNKEILYEIDEGDSDGEIKEVAG